MKILRRDPEWAAVELKCSGCGALLLVEQVDLFKTYRCYCDGSTEHFATFECAACSALNALTNVEAQGVPVHSLPTYDEWRKSKK